MNDDDFEKKLFAMAAALRRSDPTRAWKADILARARREADAITMKKALPLKRTLPPKWLVLSWAAAWIAILAMNLTAPKDATPRATGGFAGTDASGAHTASTDLRASPQTLLAFQRSMNLNPDLP